VVSLRQPIATSSSTVHTVPSYEAPESNFRSGVILPFSPPSRITPPRVSIPPRPPSRSPPLKSPPRSPTANVHSRTSYGVLYFVFHRARPSQPSQPSQPRNNALHCARIIHRPSSTSHRPCVHPQPHHHSALYPDQPDPGHCCYPSIGQIPIKKSRAPAKQRRFAALLAAPSSLLPRLPYIRILPPQTRHLSRQLTD